MSTAKISTIMVTYNSALDIVRALGSLRLQTVTPMELIIIDNASQDESVKLATRYWPNARIIRNRENMGFAAAVNQGIEAAKGNHYFLMNPDLELDQDFIRQSLLAMKLDDTISSSCGKLVRFETLRNRQIIDSVGMTMTASLRHLDRGQGELDRGQYNSPAYVFGASGAAWIIKREAIESVLVDGKAFDERFHSFREDADLSWRLRLAGWQCIYTPLAKARHRRRVTPAVRSRLPDWINRNCVRNRFLLRSNNLTAGVCLKTLLPTLVRDALVLGACLTVERSSLPAFYEVARRLPESLRRRRATMNLVDGDIDLSRWFNKGYAEPLPEEGRK